MNTMNRINYVIRNAMLIGLLLLSLANFTENTNIYDVYEVISNYDTYNFKNDFTSNRFDELIEPIVFEITLNHTAPNNNNSRNSENCDIDPHNNGYAYYYDYNLDNECDDDTPPAIAIYGNVKIEFYPVVNTNSFYLDSDVDILNISIYKHFTNQSDYNTDIYSNHEIINKMLNVTATETLLTTNIYTIAINYTISKNSYNEMYFSADISNWSSGNYSKIIASRFRGFNRVSKIFPCIQRPIKRYKFKFIIEHKYKSILMVPTKRILSRKTNDEIYSISETDTTEYIHIASIGYVLTDFNSQRYDLLYIWSPPDVNVEYMKNISIGMDIFLEEFKTNVYFHYTNIFVIPEFDKISESYTGLIYFDENVLYNPDRMDYKRKIQIALQVAYQIAYNWFGHNLTPLSKYHLWIGKGITAYLQFHGINSIEPDWNITNQFCIFYTHRAFEMDVDYRRNYFKNGKYVNKIYVDHHFPEETSIAKSAAIIRMISHLTKESTFNHALLSFYKTYFNSPERYTDTNFYEILQKDLLIDEPNAFKDSIMEFHQAMTEWGTTYGYPVLTLTQTTNGNIIFSQMKFDYVDHELKLRKNPINFWIPISYTTSCELNFNLTIARYVLKKNPTLQPIDLQLNEDEWIIANIQQTGYYRVNYFDKNWLLIIDYLSHKENIPNIHVINRAQLIDDSFNLARAGILNYGIPLKLSLYLYNETDYVPWKAATNVLRFFEQMFSGETETIEFKIYYRYLLIKEYGRLKDLTTNNTIINEHKQNIMETMCRMEYYDCINMYKEYFDKWKMDTEKRIVLSNSVPHDIRDIVYCTTLRNSGVNHWNFVYNELKLYRTNSTEFKNILKALTCTRIVWVLNNLIHDVLKNYPLLFEEFFKKFLENDVGQLIAYEFLNKRRYEILQSLPIESVKNILMYALQRVNNAFELSDYDVLLVKYQEDLGKINYDILLEESFKASINIIWKENNFGSISLFFQEITKSIIKDKNPEVIQYYNFSYKK